MKSLKLLLRFGTKAFEATVTNGGSEGVRLWGKNFFHGYYMFSFWIRKPNETVPTLRISRKLIGWTVNIPDYFELNPGQSHHIELDLHDGTWDLAELAERDNDSPIYASVEMRIDENEFTREYEIATGGVVSNELLFETYSALLSTTDEI